MKYKDQTGAGGETLSVNGSYPGHHLGSPTQGEGETEYNQDPNYNIRNMVRQGTIAQDAGDGNFPEVVQD